MQTSKECKITVRHFFLPYVGFRKLWLSFRTEKKGKKERRKCLQCLFGRFFMVILFKILNFSLNNSPH